MNFFYLQQRGISGRYLRDARRNQEVRYDPLLESELEKICGPSEKHYERHLLDARWPEPEPRFPSLR